MPPPGLPRGEDPAPAGTTARRRDGVTVQITHHVRIPRARLVIPGPGGRPARASGGMLLALQDGPAA
ncbi:hypothetical protein ACFPM0_27935 [Pseudonocardia sulfidoxydans]|uniref:hypothetical protein n=1 Tax=Pseudonocardia sulfidoxydans TaxID=54011 RepID=UPI003618CE12